MVSVLNWCGRILAAAFNGIARFFVQIVILLVILFAIVLAMGDGLSGNMVLALDGARRDARVKGVTVRLGDGAVSLAQAEEIAPALAALRRLEPERAEAVREVPPRHGSTRALEAAAVGRLRPQRPLAMAALAAMAREVAAGRT